ncbi:helix-turn-helix transcriptional regulator [Frateuria aurantia]|uniref:Putative transcriptional regulator n=1 Tax=Frateuria aurantia (strain ATCC 33424 / DSM 6220 / KCTC 2777 / LMG 1558 / NBRC 3245 / NCIMB 13370) TaxID=767434 RepID=H8L2W2_FRAAD|nr:helix-turn-helix domain-containing protein [Frateuria aurantia]AFC87318.1 putative transcriptional regulator [Frateuria aurantia DSM 6220]
MPSLARTPLQMGTLIRRRRKQLHWSQTVLASKAGLRQETVSLIENGHAAVRLDTLLDLLAALDLQLQVETRSHDYDIEDLIG